MRTLLLAFRTVPLLILIASSVRGAEPLPARDLPVTRLLGSPGEEEITVNRIVGWSGSHLGGVCIDTNHTPNRIFIMDAGNNRILGFKQFRPVQGTNVPPPDIVIGQPCLWDRRAVNGDSSRWNTPSASTLALQSPEMGPHPTHGMMAVDTNGSLYVVDRYNNRVLRYDDPFGTDGVADDVWGQADLTSRDRPDPPTASSLWTDFGSAGVEVDGAGNVWVADCGNHRVLRFPPGSKTADLVLGQPDFTSHVASNSLDRLTGPCGVRVCPHTGEVFVMDGEFWPYTWRSRMVAYVPPFSNGMAADRQFGLTTMPDNPNGDAAALHNARGFELDPSDTNIVWALDGGHSRVCKFDHRTDVILDVIGELSPTNTPNVWEGRYESYNGVIQSFREPVGSCAFDSEGNFYVVGTWESSPVLRFPMPIQRNGDGHVMSDGEMLTEGLNKRSGRTFGRDPFGMAVAGGQLFVGDQDNHRVLVWDDVASAGTFEEAGHAVGQDDMEHGDHGVFDWQRTRRMCASEEYLFVCTHPENIFIFDLPIEGSTRYYPTARILYGGSGRQNVVWDDDSTAVSFQPNGVAYDADADCLWVSDRQANRVLRIRNPVSGRPAVDMVLGQTNKTDNADNHGRGVMSPDAYGFAHPWSLELDNYGNLYVVDCGNDSWHGWEGNRRVVRFDAADLVPTPGNIFPFPAASGVFCKADLTQNRDQREDNRPHVPVDVAFDSANRMALCVDPGDGGQGRRLFYYPNPTNGPAPQPAALVPTDCGRPMALAFDENDDLMVLDNQWARIVCHGPLTNAPLVTATNPASMVDCDVTSIVIGGTASTGVVGTMTWSCNDASGAIAASATWQTPPVPLRVGGNVITIKGTNAEGVVGSAVATVTRRALEAAAPTVTPAAGAYDRPISVAIRTTTDGASIHYTTNGVTPSTNATLYAGAFLLYTNATIRAVAVKAGWYDSEVTTAVFEVAPDPGRPPESVLTVNSVYGQPSPPEGQHIYTNNATVTCSIAGGAGEVAGTRYMCTNWTGTASVVSGTGTSTVFSITTDSSITWQWTAGEHYLDLAVIGGGALDAASGWFAAGTAVVVNATVPWGREFDAWEGDTAGCTIVGTRITVPVDGPRDIVARFRAAPTLPDEWQALALPESGNRERHVALGGDGAYLYFTMGDTAACAFYRLPKGATNTADWTAMAAIPIANRFSDVSGVGDLSHYNDALWTLACAAADSDNIAVYRYDIAQNTWSHGTAMANRGPCTACAVASSNRIYGGWIGWHRVWAVTDWQTGTCQESATMNGGAAHPWDACLGRDYVYVIKHAWTAGDPGALLRIRNTGAALSDHVTGMPLNPGMGCAIEFMPGSLFADGHDRLYVLRGTTDPGDGDGNPWRTDTTTNNLAVYDIDDDLWGVETLPFAVDEGSEMCLVGNTLYVLAANGVADPLRCVELGPREYSLTVTSDHGTPAPAAGIHYFTEQSVVTCSVAQATVAEAGTEYNCTGWAGSGSVATGGVGTSTSFTITDNSAITWQWAVSRYRLELTVTGDGALDTLSQWCAPGAELTVMATPDEGWQFDAWNGDTEGCVIVDDEITVTMDRARAITAVFSPLGPPSLTVSSEYGAPAPGTGTHVYVRGGRIECRIGGSPVVVGGTRYACTNWTGTGSVRDGCGDAMAFTITRNSALTWEWNADAHWLELGTVGRGGFSQGETGWQAAGATVRVEARGEPWAWHFDTWEGDLDGCVLNGWVIDIPMDRPRRVTARFVADAPDLLGDYISSWDLPTGDTRDRHVALGSYDQHLFFSLADSADAPFYRFESAWHALASVPMPAPVDDDSGLGDMSLFGSHLWTLGRHTGGMTENCVYRYDIARDIWRKGNAMAGNGPNGACAVWRTNRIFGARLDSSTLHTVTDWINGTGVSGTNLSGGAVVCWDACVGTGAVYVIKHATTAGAAGILARVDPDSGPGVTPLGGMPFNPGMGCAVEYMPGNLFSDHHDRLYVLRGGTGTTDGNGADWTTDSATDNLAIYDLVDTTWTSVTLPFATDEGSEMCRAYTYLFILAANGTTKPLRRVQFDTFVELPPARPLPTPPLTRYVSLAGSHTPPYTNWATAANGIHHAVDAAADGDEVVVGDGTYALITDLAIDRELTIRGANGAEHAILDGGNGVGGHVVLDHPAAILEGLTVTRCVAATGGGITLGAGLVSNCIVHGNSASREGGGVWVDDGTLVNCNIFSNTVTGTYDDSGLGGGVHVDRGGVVRGCAIWRNRVYDNGSGEGLPSRGGGLYSAWDAACIESCTIVDNSAEGWGGGVYGSGGVTNCIILHNNASFGPNGVTDLSYGFTCMMPLMPGDGNTTEAPQFVDLATDDLRLRPGTAGVDDGTNLTWMAGAVDLSGAPRVTAGSVDRGAYESHDGALLCNILPSSRDVFIPADVVLEAAVSGTNLIGVYYRWDLDNDGAADVEGYDRHTITNTYPTQGVFAVSLSVSNAIGEVDAFRWADCIRAGAANLYVSHAGTHAPPFDSWGTAATNLADAVAVAAGGSTISIANGTYELDSQIVVDKGITIAGVSNASNVVLRSSGGDRCFYLDHPDALIECVTITGGGTERADGGGVHIYGGGTLRDCVIVSNTARYASGGGVAISHTGTIERCLIADNEATEEFVDIGYNGGRGGGVHLNGGGLVDRCRVTRNTAYWYGAVNCDGGEVRGSVVDFNASDTRAGGVACIGGGRVRNCTIIGNTSTDVGGVELMSYGGGGSVENCIIEDNSAPGADDNWSGDGFSFCLSDPLIPGADNITGRVDYLDYPRGDYRLRPLSPAINRGLNQAWMLGASDMEGDPRICDSNVDLGADEFAVGPLRCTFFASSDQVFAASNVTLTAHVTGTNLDGVVYCWDVDNDGVFDHTGSDLATLDFDYDVPGLQSVRLVVSNAVGETDAMVREDEIRVGVWDLYVSGDGADVFPYTSWGLAARSLEAATELAVAGTTVWVTNGVYALADEIPLDRGVSIRGVGDREAVVVSRDGSGRCFTLSGDGALVSGLTIRGGGDVDYGGGVYALAGTVTHCTIFSNACGYEGGGVYAEGAVIDSCILYGNTAGRETENRNAWRSGGGITANGSNTVIRGCLVHGNTVEDTGFFNVGGDVLAHSGASVESSTIGDLYGKDSTLRNTIVLHPYGWRTSLPNCDVFYSRVIPYTSGSFAPRLFGVDCFEGDPLFVDVEGGDFRLRPDSPCINAGTNQAWMIAATDTAGNARILDGVVDMGALEYDPSQVIVRWTSPADAFLHGDEIIGWEAISSLSSTLTVSLVAASAGRDYDLGAGLDPSGNVAWATESVPDGVYELRATVDSTGDDVAAQASRWVLVNNSVAWHSGALTSNETWAADVVHVVETTVTVASAVTLTIEPGAVVKFAPGARIVVADGGRLDALATAAAPIVLTSLADDAAGGDSNQDADDTAPAPGDWPGIDVQGSGVANLSEHVETRYVRFTHDGPIAADETWAGSCLHEVTADVTVPPGATLTIREGAVVKFAAATSLHVQGQLLTQGTLTRPVTLTSIRDDSVGGDSNGDGDDTSPAAGDWGQVRVPGNAALVHTMMRYGAGDVETLPAMVKVVGLSSSVTLDGCRLEDALRDAVITWGGLTTLRNCVILSAARGVLARENSEVRIVNCTLRNHVWGVSAHGGMTVVRNCSITDNAEYGVQGDPDVFVYNNVWRSGLRDYSQVDLTGTNGNVSVDPLYRNADAGNFQLDYLSPLVDAADTTVAPTNDYLGAPRYDDPRSPNTGVAAAGACADIGAFEFVETAESDMDLVAEGVTGPAEITAGGYAVVSWNIINRGAASVTGEWWDEIQLAPVVSDGWNDPIVVAEVLSAATLGPGQSAGFDARVRVPGGTEGDWQWRVKANSRGDVFEGVHWNNNLSVPSISSALSVPELTVGDSHDGAFAGEGQPSWYLVNQSAGEDLRVAVAAVADSGRSALYVGFGRMPTTEHFDLRDRRWGTPDVALSIPAADVDRVVYLLLMPESLAPDESTRYAIDVDTLEFGITSIDLPAAGDGGIATIPINGARFDEDLSVLLRETGGGTSIAAFRTVVSSATYMLARFDLAGATRGSYDVVLDRGGVERSLVGAFQVLPGRGGGRFTAELVLPSAVRAGRPFSGRVDYRNIGDSDVPAPLLVLMAGDETRLSRDGAEEQTATQLHFLAGALDRPLPSVLIPGDSFSYAFEARVLSGMTAEIQLTSLRVEGDPAMDYATLLDSVDPEHPHPLFGAAWDHMVASTGVSREDYVQMLRDALDRAAAFDLSADTEGDVLTFLVRESVEDVQDAVVSGTAYVGDTDHPLGRVPIYLRPLSRDTNVYATVTWFDGTFGIRGVTAGRYGVHIPGYLPSRLASIEVDDPATPVTGLTIVATEKAGTFEGQVTLAGTGEPVTDAAVVIREEDGLLRDGTVVDEEGRFSIGDLHGSRYTVQVWAPQTRPEPVSTVTIPSGTTVGRSYVLSPEGAVITGVVRDSGSSPVADALVAADWQDHTDSYGSWHGVTARTESDGSYALRGLPPGGYHIAASAPGVGVSHMTEVTLASAEAEAVVNLTLLTGVAITGTVVDQGTGSPVTGAIVNVADVYPPMDPDTLSDAAGQFTLTHLPTGNLDVVAFRHGYEPGHTNITLLPSGNGHVTVPLHPRGQVSGRVTNLGQPLASALISFLSRTDAGFMTIPTSADGAYAIRDLPPDDYSIAVGGIDGLSWGRQDFSITPASNIWTFDFNLQLSAITGTTWQADGLTPVTNAYVYAVKDGEPLGGIVAESDGSYSLPVHEPGTYAVVAKARGALFAPRAGITVPSAGSIVQADLTASSNGLAVTITAEADGAPVTNAEMWVRSALPSMVELMRQGVEADASGVASVASLAGGDYDVCILAPGLAVHTQRVNVSTNALLNVALKPGRSIRGHVSADGEDAPFAAVWLLAPGHGVVHAALADENGDYDLGMTPEGVFDLMVEYGRSEATVREGIDMSGATSNRIEDFVLPASSSNAVSGVVLDGHGRRVTGAQLRLIHELGGQVTGGISDNRGEFDLRGWPSGAYSLKVDAPGYVGTTNGLLLDRNVTVTGLVVTVSDPLCGVSAVSDVDEVVQTLVAKSGRSSPRTLGDDTGAFSWLDGASDLDWGSLTTPDFWDDVLGGSMGVESPYITKDNYNMDFKRDFVDPLNEALGTDRQECVQAIFDEAKKCHDFMDRIYDNWWSAYETMKDRNSTEVLLSITRGAEVAAKAVKTLMSFGKPDDGLFDGMPEPAKDLMMDAYGDVMGKIGQLGSVPQQGDPTWRDKVMGIEGEVAKVNGQYTPLLNMTANIHSEQAHTAIQNLKGGYNDPAARGYLDDLAAYDNRKELMSQVGAYLDAIEAVDAALTYLDQIKTMNKTVLASMDQYKEAQDLYNKQAKKYKALAGRMKARGDDCKVSDGTESDDPEYPPYWVDFVDEAELAVPVSEDPNDKSTVGLGSNGVVRAGQRLDYLIRFENVSTAAAPAQIVVVTDTLDDTLDETTFELGEIGFNNVVVPVGSGLMHFEATTNVATDPNPVRVKADFNPDTRVAQWTIRSVDRVTGGWPEDPWSGFLPPNVTNSIGDGYVSFSVLPKDTLADGAAITNLASIVFDVNDPIITPTVTNTLDTSAPASAVSALPARTPKTFALSWSGHDTGAGVRSYDIYVSREGEDFVPLLTGVTGTTAVVAADPGVRYGFMTRAIDRVGNAEDLPAAADAETTTEFFMLSSDVMRAGDTNRVVLSWESAEGIRYLVSRSGDLTNTFTNVTGELPATPPLNVYTDTVDRAMYYRIRRAE